MTWRHLDFFQHQAYLHARVPRVRCSGCGIKRVSVPWAREGSGFALLFEALALTMMTSMPVAAVGRLVGEHGFGSRRRTAVWTNRYLRKRASNEPPRHGWRWHR